MNLLTEEDLAEWVTYMRGKGLSPKTIGNLHGFLYSVIKISIYKKYRADNPCEHTRLPKADHTEDKTTFLTRAELVLILKHLDKHFHPLILFLVVTGLRSVRLRHSFQETSVTPVGNTRCESRKHGSLTISTADRWARRKLHAPAELCQ